MTAGSPHSSAGALAHPPAAERARTVAARPSASLFGAGLGICQLWGATTTASGDVLLVVPQDGAVTTALRDSPVGDVPARLTVTDRTPFPLRHPVRGLVQLSGWVTPVPADDVPRLLLDFADAYPCDSLFDVGLSATLVRLDLAEVLLEEAGVSADVEPGRLPGRPPGRDQQWGERAHGGRVRGAQPADRPRAAVGRPARRRPAAGPRSLRRPLPGAEP